MVTFWDNCTIKAKLLLGIGAILAVFAASSVVVLLFVNSLALAGSADQALRHIIPLRALALDAPVRTIDADDNGAYYVTDPNASNWPDDLENYSADIAAVKAALPKLHDSADTDRDREMMAALTTWFDMYSAGNERSFASSAPAIGKRRSRASFW